MKMIWKEIDANNLPQEEVLARSEDGKMLIGFLGYISDRLVCDDDSHIIIPRYYITKTELGDLPVQSPGKSKRIRTEHGLVEPKKIIPKQYKF